MAKIHAGFSDLKASHFRLSAAANNAKGPPAHLLLFYAAECGLKCAYLRRLNLRTTEQLGDVDHDLGSLIKNLNISKSTLGSAPALHLSRRQNEPCNASSAHQAWRYGVRIDAVDEANFVTWLQKVCEVAKEHL
jgi:hypothetical protein